MKREFDKMAGQLRSKLRQVVSRCVVNLINDAMKMQECQVTILADEPLDGVERFQDYGITSHPRPGAEGLALSVGANRSHAVVIRIDDRRYRLQNLQPGEVALYDDQGQKIVLHRDRIEVEAPKVVVLSDNVFLGDETGANPVARIGDTVNVAAGSSAGSWPITSGSNKVSAA